MSTTANSVTSESIIELTINGLLSVYRNSISSSFNGQKFKVSGHYIDRKKESNRYYYDVLKESDSKEYITLFLNEKQKRLLTNGEYYDFIGRIEITKNIQYSNLSILFVPDAFEKSKEDVQLIPESKYNLIRERYNRGLTNVEVIFSEKLYQREKPKILLITGKNSIVLKDFFNQLIDKEHYDIEEYRLNLSSKTPYFELLSTLKSEEYTAIAIVRGGGTGLEIFDEEDLCQKFLETNIPIITAIGHQQDQTLLEKIADIGYATPSTFGTALQKLVDKDQSIKSDHDNLKYTIAKNKEQFQQEMQKCNEEHAQNIGVLNAKITQLTKILIGCILFIMLTFLVLYLVK